MIFYKIFGALLMLSFIAMFWRPRTVAREMTDFCDSLPMAEGWDEEDFDDLPQYRVESEDWMPVSVTRD